MTSFLHRYSLVVGFAIIPLLGHAQNASVPPQAPRDAFKSEKEVKSILQDICDRINELYKAEGFPLKVPSFDKGSFTFHAASKSWPANWEAHAPNEGPSAGILAESGRVTGFTYMAVQNAIDANLNAPPPVDQLTQEQVIGEATKFADIFTRSWRPHLSKPVLDGWQVRWSELSSSGVPFLDCGVTVYVSPKYGPYSIGTNLGTCPYVDNHVKTIPQKEALSRAANELNRMLNKSLSQDSKPTIGLQIVSASNEGRLAWVVVYEEPPSAKGYTIIIDAENGKVLSSRGPLIVN
jgi:Peptidase propeptide and YPEB domain